MVVSVVNYDKYQAIGNYKSDTKSDLEAKQKRNRSDTINKNDKNVKNDNKNTGIKNSFKKPYIENDRAYKKGNTWYVIVGGEHKEYVGNVKDHLVWK